MKEKSFKLYTEVGILYFNKRIINNVPTLIISRKDRVEIILKQYLYEANENKKIGYIIYYNTDVNLESFIESDYINDLYKAENNIDGYENILQKISADVYIVNEDIDNIRDEEILTRVKPLLSFIPLTNEEKKKCLSYSSEKHPVYNKKAVLEINTPSGKITIEPNNKEFPDGCIVKLNNAPIVLIESIKDKSGQDKLVVKRYPNKKTVNDDEYINLESYGIQLDELNSKLIKTILDSVKEE